MLFRSIKDNFNYFLEPTKDNGSTNLTVCLLIDYSSQKNLYHAKKLIMHTLLTEKMYVRYHSDLLLTVKSRKIGFFTRHHPDFIHIEAMQLRVHKAMKRTFLKHKGRYDRIIEKFKARPIDCVEDLPQLQLHKHSTNPLQRTNGFFPAINLYAPTEYHALY